MSELKQNNDCIVKVGISGCLGFFLNCRYDGENLNNFDLKQAENFLKKELSANNIEFIPFCPEQLGGLPTPRIQAEIVGGTAQDVWDDKAKVMTKDCRDVTENFKRGAEQVLNAVNILGIEAFLLKEKSPSCGVIEIYSGKFDGVKVPGEGVTTSLLRKNGIKVFSGGW